MKYAVDEKLLLAKQAAAHKKSKKKAKEDARLPKPTSYTTPGSINASRDSSDDESSSADYITSLKEQRSTMTKDYKEMKYAVDEKLLLAKQAAAHKKSKKKAKEDARLPQATPYTNPSSIKASRDSSDDEPSFSNYKSTTSKDFKEMKYAVDEKLLLARQALSHKQQAKEDATLLKATPYSAPKAKKEDKPVYQGLKSYQVAGPTYAPNKNALQIAREKARERMMLAKQANTATKSVYEYEQEDKLIETGKLQLARTDAFRTIDNHESTVRLD
jgi:hypothetical protein